MSRALFIFFVGWLTLGAWGAALKSGPEAWVFFDTFALKKDQIQQIEIRNGRDRYNLSFRWTLFVNEGLVMHVTYEGHAYQPLLYRQYKRDTFKVDLFAQPEDASALERERPYALIQFKAFDPKKHRAHLDVRIKSDEKLNVLYQKGQ